MPDFNLGQGVTPSCEMGSPQLIGAHHAPPQLTPQCINGLVCRLT